MSDAAREQAQDPSDAYARQAQTFPTVTPDQIDSRPVENLFVMIGRAEHGMAGRSSLHQHLAGLRELRSEDRAEGAEDPLPPPEPRPSAGL